jgi:hypothetical protein
VLWRTVFCLVWRVQQNSYPQLMAHHLMRCVVVIHMAVAFVANILDHVENLMVRIKACAWLRMSMQYQCHFRRKNLSGTDQRTLSQDTTRIVTLAECFKTVGYVLAHLVTLMTNCIPSGTSPRPFFVGHSTNHRGVVGQEFANSEWPTAYSWLSANCTSEAKGWSSISRRQEPSRPLFLIKLFKSF